MAQPLYISDLDGTLLRSDATLSACSREMLNGLLDQGAAFTVATARRVASVAVMLKGLRLTLPIIEFNGAFLTDVCSGQHEVVNALPADTAGELYRLIVNTGCVPLISSYNGREDCLHFPDATNEGMRWYHGDRLKHKDRRLRPAGDARHALAEQVVCLTVIDHGERLGELEQAVRSTCGEAVVTHLIENAYSPPWHWLTMHDRRATKDQAIRTLVDRYDFGDHEVVVFGDQVNDIGMFKAAHHAVAVGNAAEPVTRHAGTIIGTNDEDSVAHFISADWKRRAPTSR